MLQDGPYNILRNRIIDNLTIKLVPGVTERLNVQRLKPYFEQGFRSSSDLLIYAYYVT